MDTYHVPNSHNADIGQAGQIVPGNSTMVGKHLVPNPMVVKNSFLNSSLGYDSSINFTDDHFHWLPAIYRENNTRSYEQIQELCETFESYNFFRLVVDVFVVGPMCVLGLIGNSLAIKVLRTDNVNYTVSFLLQALAVADNAYLLTCIFMQTIKSLAECTSWFYPGLLFAYPYMEPYVWPSASIAQTATVWLTVLVTWDRYTAICRPFASFRLYTPKRAKKAVFCVVVAAILYNIPRFFDHVVQERPDYCKEVIRPVTTHSHLREDQVYFILYKTVLYNIFRVVLPLGTLAILNTRLIVTLKDVRQNHAALTKTSFSNRIDSFAVILVGMVTVFMICETPEFLLRTFVTVLHFTKGKTADMMIKISYLNTVSNTFLTLNSSINCLVYCLVGRRFRKILARLFCRSFEQPRKPPKKFQQSFTSSKLMKDTFM